jgi:hypothetical protein
MSLESREEIDDFHGRIQNIGTQSSRCRHPVFAEPLEIRQIDEYEPASPRRY